MLRLPLKKAEVSELFSLFFSSHQLRVKIELTDLDQNFLGNISRMLVDIQVDGDASSEVEMSASLTLFDPGHSLQITSDNPGDGAMYFDRMIKVTMCYASPGSSNFYEVPVFFGPISKLDKQGDVVMLEVQGKEYLMYSSVFKKDNLKKGRKATDIMKNIFRTYGEVFYSVPDLPDTIDKDLAVGLDAIPWQLQKRLASVLNRDLKYSATGTAMLRRRNPDVKYVFDKFTAEPQISFNADTLINAVLVIGAKPKGKGKKAVQYEAVPDKSHPLSPWKMGRTVGGEVRPRYYRAIIEDPKLKTKKACKVQAEKRLAQGLLESVEVSFESMWVTTLQLNDVIGVKTSDYFVQARLRQFSGDPKTGRAAYGFNKNMRPASKQIRRNRK